MTAPSPSPTADCLGYVRVSTDDQARDIKSSLGDQRAAISALAQKLGRRLEDADVFEDAGYSGGTADRPAFRSLLAFCADHSRTRAKIGFVLILNDSRFGRFDADEAAHWRFVLRQSGWHVKFAEADETDDPVVRPIMRAVGAAQAAEYRRNLRANTRRGGRGAATRGLWQGVAPIGYRRYAFRPGEEPTVLENGKRKADDQAVRLGLGPEDEQALVRGMFQSYASDGGTLRGLARELRQTWPGRSWCAATVLSILRNVVYAGDVVYGRRPIDDDGMQINVGVGSDAWIVTRDAHPALVSRELFATVQNRLKVNKRQHRRHTGGGYALSGLMTCAHCGHPYTGGGGNTTKRPYSDPDRYRYYKDSGGTWERNACPGRLGTISKRYVEPLIIGAVSRVVAHPLVQRRITEEVDRVLDSSFDAHAATRQRLERDRDRLSVEIDRLASAVARGVLTDRDAERTLRGLRAQRDAVAAELDQLRFEGRAADRLLNERDELLALAADFPARIAGVPATVQRELLKPWIHRAVIDKEKRTLTLDIRRVPGIGVFVPVFSTPARDSRPLCAAAERIPS